MTVRACSFLNFWVTFFGKLLQVMEAGKTLPNLLTSQVLYTFAVLQLFNTTFKLYALS